MLAGVPDGGIDPPPEVKRIAGGRSLRPVWRNLLGGLTFELGSGASRRFIKWAPAGSGLDLDAEADRLEWAAKLTPVPHVVDRGGDDTGRWIVTSGLPGENAVSEPWRSQPAVAVRAIGTGLRALHDALPAQSCPFSWSLEERLAVVHQRAYAELLKPEEWHQEHRSLSVGQALAVLDDRPEVDRLVVCHGDACAPNTLITAAGSWSGTVDLGALGTGDRWADLAVATWSADWNYGPGWEEELLAMPAT